MSLPEVLQRIATAFDQAEVAYMLTGSFDVIFGGVLAVHLIRRDIAIR
jgi:hypothetical protein